MEIFNQGLIEAIRVGQTIEAQCDDEEWKEGGPCPVLVGGFPCGGRLLRSEGHFEITLYCSEYATHHYIEIPRV